jgi:hypothetical protein
MGNKQTLEAYFAVEETKGFKDAREFEGVVGNFFEHKNFVEGFLRMHRTNMQSAVSLMFKCIEALAQVEDNRVDPRNQAARDTCRKAVAGYKEEMRKFYISEGMSEEKAKEYSDMTVVLPSNLPHI